ncbi:MAG: DNA polymerase III subunit delta [Chloroflexota bacterium]|nr:DNA polymerase III subunit delta [Chloroflexota bacterium]
MKPQLIYILHGSDRFTRDEQVRSLKRRMLAEPSGEYNLAMLAGSDVGLSELRTVADALPFLGDRRLVIVEGLLGRLAGQTKPSARRGRGKTAKEAAPRDAGAPGPLDTLLDYLQELPPTTALVFVEDQVDVGAIERRLPKDRAHVRGYDRPRPSDLSSWIDRRVRHHKGKMEAAAVRQLAQLAPDDLGLLENEIAKLVTYADGRTVTTDDVELLSASPEVTVFALLDAIALGQRGRALAQLRALFQRGERSEAILPQIGSTMRRLIQARELLDLGVRGPQLQRRLGVHPFLAEKTERQARGYRMDQLEAALRLLLDTDRAIKTGEAEPELALELFICDLPRVG